jgi:hypothetical protein
LFKKEKPWRGRWSCAVLLALAVGSAHGVPSRRLDLNGVQEGPKCLSEGRGKNFRGQISDVRRDLPPSQELCNFIAKGVTVVFK